MMNFRARVARQAAVAAIVAGLAAVLTLTSASARGEPGGEGHGGVTSLSAGWFHTCAVVDGGAWCWGLNSRGELGNGDLSHNWSDVATPVVGLSRGVTQIGSGRDFTCALKDGGVWCWGEESNGQDGDGALPATVRYLPVSVVGLGRSVTQISVGTDHACALRDGGVWCWGSNSAGQVGNNSFLDAFVPQSVAGLAHGVRSVSAGHFFSCALKIDDSVWCWGSNVLGELGVPQPPVTSRVPIRVPSLANHVRSIATGDSACVVLRSAAWCWGGASLGNGTFAGSVTPVAVDGMNRGVTALSDGIGHSCAIKSGGAWCWGANYSGQLGDNTTVARRSPVAVIGLSSGVILIAAGYGHTCAAWRGNVWCWGDGWAGRLGNGARAESNVPVRVVGINMSRERDD